MKVKCIQSLTDTFINGEYYEANLTGIMPLHAEVFINDKRKLFGFMKTDRKHILVFGKDIYKFEIVEDSE